MKDCLDFPQLTQDVEDFYLSTLFFRYHGMHPTWLLTLARLHPPGVAALAQQVILPIYLEVLPELNRELPSRAFIEISASEAEGEPSVRG